MRYGADSFFVYPNPAETIGLAKRAKYHGMTIETITTGVRVDHYVVDPRDGSRHYVTLVSCGCRQFVGSGSAACQHLALMQAACNVIPEAVATVELEAVR